ncbi:MAG TPA: hypothetical protein VGE74_13785 [Gemmata sp.]
MGVSREQAIELAVRFYSRGRAAVIRSRAELARVRGDIALVLTHATHSSANPEFDVPGSQSGPGWWVAFEELCRQGERWGPPDIHPSGGFVRVCEATGSLFQPSLM